MRKAYSVDLRYKVLAFIAGGGGKREAAQIFGIGEDTIYRWRRREKTGDIRPKVRTVYPMKMNTETLKEYVAQNPDHTITEIAGALQLGRTAVFTWLKRLQLTRKKRPRATKNGVRTSGLTL